MTKRTPTTPTQNTKLHKTAVQDSGVMDLGNAQTLPKPLKTSAKNKAQAQAQAQRDEDARAAEQEDASTTANTAPPVRDDAWVNTSHDLQLAQANTSSNSPSAPASVGEDLLRQAGPVPTKTTAAQDTGFFSTSWGLPVALGAGALALAAAGGGGGGGGDAPKKEPATTPDGGTGGTTTATTTFTIVPYAGKFIENTNGAANVIAKLWKVNADGTLKEIGSSAVVGKTGGITVSAKNTDLTLAAGEYLKVTLTDNNGTAPNYYDEAQQTSTSNSLVAAPVSLGTDTDLTTLLSAVPKSGELIAVTPLTTVAALRAIDAMRADPALNVTQAISQEDDKVAKAFDIQSGITHSNPAQSASYQKALALISGYAESKGATTTQSKMAEVLTDLKAAVVTPADLKAILQKGLSQLPDDYTNPSGGITPFVLPSLEFADTAAQLNGPPTVNLVNYNDGLAFKIHPGTGTRVGDQATLTFIEKGNPTHTFTYVYTFQGNVLDGSNVGDEITRAETFAIPRFNDSNPTALTEYTDANGRTLLPLNNGGLPDGLSHQYTVDLVVGNASIGKGLDGSTPASTLTINTAPVSLRNPLLDGSTVFNSFDEIAVSVSLNEKVSWVKGNPTLKLHVDDGTPTGHDITLQLDSGFTTGDKSSKPTNVLVFKAKLNLDPIAGAISIPDNAIQFPADAKIFNVAGAKTDTAWFNGLVKTALTPSLTIDSVLPSTATLDLKPGDWITLDAQGAANANLSVGDKLAQKNQLPISVTVDDLGLTGDGAKVRLFWSKTSDGKGTAALATKAVTTGSSVVDIATSDYVDSGAATYIGGSTGASATGSIFYLYTQVVDAAGNVGPLSQPFKVVIDNTAPTAPELDLPTADDTGGSATDNITALTKPQIKVTGERGAKVTLFDDANGDGLAQASEILDTGNTGTEGANGKYTYTWTPSADLVAGPHHLKATLTDVAGNTSLTGALDVTILTPLTTKPSVAFANPPSTGYNTVSTSDPSAKTITVNVTYEREMYVGTDTSGLTLQLTLAGQTRNATYSGISTDPSTHRTTLTFTYTLGSSDAGLSGSVGITGLSGAEIVVQDVAGNPAPAGVLPTTGALPTIDTQPPALPTIAIKDTEANASSATTDGAVAITAEGGATVTVTFTNTTQPTQKPQTVVVTGAGTAEVLAKLLPEQVMALGQGTIKVTAEAKDAVGNSSGTTVSDSSFTLDTVAPHVTSVTDDTTALVTKGDIVFTVKFSEALTTTPQKTDFTVVEGMGTVESVVRDTTPGALNSYKVTVKPAKNIAKGQVQLGFSEDSTLQDAAGNKAADTLAKFSTATQAIDTQAPIVTAVSSTGGSVAKGEFDFIVTFSEAMGPAAITGSPPSPSNFTVTNGTVKSVTLVTTTDGSVKYKVTVTPTSGLDAGATMKLSLVASADDTNSYIADALGNLALNADLSTGSLGGTQAIDTKAPDLPSINVKVSAVNQAKATSATDAAVAIKAEDGATVTVTFTNSDDATKTPQTVVVTGKGAATDVFVALNEQQVKALGQGSIKVTAEAKDAALNSSGTTELATAPTFTLDTVAPTVRISSDKTQLKLGDTATVTFTFSEDPGTSFDASDVTVSGGTLGAISGSGLTRTATFTADKPNLLGEQATVSVGANSYTDAAKNDGTAGSSPSASFMLVDTVAPTIMGFTSTAVSGTYGIGSKITLRATASEAVKDSAYLDVTLNSNATSVRLTRSTSNPNVFEGDYTVASGDSIPISAPVQTLQVQSFTASGTDNVGNTIVTTMPIGGGNLDASLVIAGIAPLAPNSFALNSASDTGLVGDYITSQTTPGFDFKGLVVGTTVKIYNGAAVVHSFVATSVEMSNIKLPTALAVGNYANLKVVQVDAIGNESPALVLPKALQIQSPAAIPTALSGLTLDPVLDMQTQYEYESNLPGSSFADYTTFLRTPKFIFKGGVTGNTAILFRDSDGDGKYDSTKDILLGTATITVPVNGFQSISVDATNALANTPKNQSGYTDIKVVQQDAAGQTSVASNAALCPEGSRKGLGLVIANTDATTLTDLTGFSLSSSTSTDASNAETLTFTVRGVTQPGAKVVITATQLLNGETKQITLPATALTGATDDANNLVVDVRGFEGTLSNFKAKQTWAGLTSADIAISGDVSQVVLDHVAPTVAISTDQALPLSQDQTCVIKFKFSEVVSDFTINKITVSSGTLTGLAQDTTDATLWTANYKGLLGSTTPAYIFVGSGAFKDAAKNLNNDGADSNNILNLSFRPINHAPTAANKTISLNEDGSYTITVNDLGYSDSDGNTLQSVKITTLPTAGKLKLEGVDVTEGQSIPVADITANKLVFAPVANANGNGHANIGFQVQDNGGTAGGGADTSVTYALNFNVASVNDAPTATGKPLDLKENTSYTFAVSDFGFGDANDSPANAFSSVIITKLPTAGTLQLNGVNVTKDQSIAVADITKLVYKPALNANGNDASTSIGFKVKDNGGTANGGVDTSAEATFTVNVASVNDAPTGANKSFTINEDSSTTLAVSDFGFADANDSPANAFSKVIITTLPTAGALKLDGVDVTVGQSILVADITANKLVFAPVANANGNGYANIGFKVQDDGGTANGGVDTSTTANTLTFNVTEVNDAPTATGKALDLKEDSSYTFAVSDFGFGDANDSPVNAFSSVIISTLPTAGTLKLSGVNVTLGQTIAVADITAGKLVFAPAANASGNGYANIGFKVKDNGGLTNGGDDTSAEATFTVNVASVNDAPTGLSQTLSVVQGTSYAFKVDDFGFADANDSPVNAFSNVIITTLPAAGALKLNGVTVTSGQIIAVADITAGNLVFTPAANASGSDYANIGFKVQDDGGIANGGVDTSTATYVATVNITPINHAPTGKDASVALNEDTPYAIKTSDFGFVDAAGDTHRLKSVIITTLPTVGTLKLDGADVTVGQSISVADITANKLVFAPAANANGNGYANIGFKVQDDGGTANGGADTSTTANTLTFNVTEVNDAPTATGKPLDLKENTSYTFAVSDFGFGDANDSPAANAFSSVIISTLPTAGTLKLNDVTVTAGQSILVADITAGKLVYKPALNANGNGYANIGFKVKDNGGTANGGVDTSTEATLTVNVASVNDAPTGTNKSFTINEDSTTTLAVSDFGFADANDAPASNHLSNVIITTLPTAGTLKLDGVDVVAGQSISVADITANKLVFAPAANANGNGYANIGFKVQDDGGTANGGVDTSTTANTLTFNVTPVNDAPVGNVTIGGYAAGTAPVVGQELSVTHNITDVDGIPATGPNAIHYQWYANGAEITGATGSTFTLTGAQMGRAITVKAFYQDNGGTSEVVTTATDPVTLAPTATPAVALPTSIAMSGLSFHSLDSGGTTPVAMSSDAKLVLGHDGVYLLDVNGDGAINASDRTTYAQGLDATGSITIGHLKFTLLSETTWNGLKSALATYTDWPAADTKGTTPTNGNDYWTSTVGLLPLTPSTPAHVVFNTAGNYSIADNAAVAANTRLHYNAFQVIAV